MNSPMIQRSVGSSRDARSAGDHDCPYVFGKLPKVVAPFPFSTREFARLMVLRSRVRNGLLTRDS